MASAATAILLDLDGVLVDSRTAISRSINYALAEQGFPQPSLTSLERFIGPQLTLAFAELTGHPPDSSVVLACLASYRARYRDASLRETTVVDGIPAVLGELSGQHRLAVATSKPLAFAEPLLVALDLRDALDHVAAPDLGAHHEDKAATIHSALNALGTQRAVMVGDRSFDIIGAHACAIRAIGVSWGIGTRNELADANADRIVGEPGELPGVVSDLLA
ncbi:MAG: HAD hydrolase-like protein [Solirubrobacteraceae bacterium]